MTLIGAINKNNNKIIFADRKWQYSANDDYKKIFYDDKNNRFLLTSGFIIKTFTENFQDAKYKNIRSLIKEKSFLCYDFNEDSLNAYHVIDNRFFESQIINYAFLGYKAKELQDSFDFMDVDHTLIPSLMFHHKKYPNYIGNEFDIIKIENKTLVFLSARFG